MAKIYDKQSYLNLKINYIEESKEKSLRKGEKSVAIHLYCWILLVIKLDYRTVWECVELVLLVPPRVYGE